MDRILSAEDSGRYSMAANGKASNRSLPRDHVVIRIARVFVGRSDATQLIFAQRQRDYAYLKRTTSCVCIIGIRGLI